MLLYCFTGDDFMCTCLNTSLLTTNIGAGQAGGQCYLGSCLRTVTVTKLVLPIFQETGGKVRGRDRKNNCFDFMGFFIY